MHSAYGLRLEKTAVLAVAAALLMGAHFSAHFCAPARAEEGNAGTQSVFTIGAGSRAIALGRSFVSIADDASAVYWNPAALRNVQSKQLMFMYMPLFGDFTGADYTFFGAVYPTLNAGAFGAGFQRVATSFEGYDDFSRPTGEGDYSESQVLISYAFERTSKWLLGSLATGATFKIVSQKVDPFSSTAPGIDLGFRWRPLSSRSFAIGVNLQDLSGAEHKLDAATDVTYRTVMAGAGYVREFANGSALRLALEVDLPEKADYNYHAGAEYAFARYISLRAGYDDGNVSFGVGFNISHYGVDYGYFTREEAGTSHPVSFTMDVGSTLEEQRQRAADREAAELRRLMGQEFENRVAARRERAKALESTGEWASALDEWKIVLEYIPEDPEASAGADRVRGKVLAMQEAATKDAEGRAVIRTRFEQGLKFYEDKNYARARGEWQAILALDSTHAAAREYMDKTQERIDEAIQVHMRRANELERTGRHTEAIAEWNNVQQYDPGNAQARSAIERIRTQIESVSKDYEAAQRRLRTVSLYDDALQQYNQGAYQAAIADLEQLLQLQADHEDAKRLLALANRKLSPLTPEETEQIRKLYLSGMQLFSKDEYAKAIAEWEKILRIDPTNDSVRRNIEEAKERLKQLQNRE